MLKLVSMVDRYKLDAGIEHTLRTGMAPEDVGALIGDPNMKLDSVRNASSLLMKEAKPYVNRAQKDRCMTLVPTLKRIDQLRDTWGLDPEAEALLKFMVPSTKVVR